MTFDDAKRCPCGTGLPFGECCAPIQRREREARHHRARLHQRHAGYRTHVAVPMT